MSYVEEQYQLVVEYLEVYHLQIEHKNWPDFDFLRICSWANLNTNWFYKLQLSFIDNHWFWVNRMKKFCTKCVTTWRKVDHPFHFRIIPVLGSGSLNVFGNTKYFYWTRTRTSCQSSISRMFFTIHLVFTTRTMRICDRSWLILTVTTVTFVGDELVD